MDEVNAEVCSKNGWTRGVLDKQDMGNERNPSGFKLGLLKSGKVSPSSEVVTNLLPPLSRTLELRDLSNSNGSPLPPITPGIPKNTEENKTKFEENSNNYDTGLPESPPFYNESQKNPLIPSQTKIVPLTLSEEEKSRKKKRKLVLFLVLLVVLLVIIVSSISIPLALSNNSPNVGGRAGGDSICEKLSYPVINGGLSCNGTIAGSICTSVCSHGYTSNQSYTSNQTQAGYHVCQPGGEWSGEEMSLCFPVDCGNLKCVSDGGPSYLSLNHREQCQLNNGVINCTDSWSNGTCEMKCHPLYVQSLPAPSCQINGSWLNTEADCIPVNPCASGDHDCDFQAGECINTSPGTYTCQCKLGYAGDGKSCGHDTDLDGFPDSSLEEVCSSKHCQEDNCGAIPNSGQEDNDKDGVGDACEIDPDSDGVNGTDDNCPLVANSDQLDTDGDTVGDACDICPTVPNMHQTDPKGVNCDDIDGDGIPNTVDNCWLQANPQQTDTDNDVIGDACDNCPSTANALQEDTDENLVGDACQGGVDVDRDGITDDVDNCKDHPNADQLDSDNDGLGDDCDVDKDGDSITNLQDNCPVVPNTDQLDSNNDGIGDACSGDADADLSKDEEDEFPVNKKLDKTDFRKFMEVIFDDKGNAQPPPYWIIRDNGAEIIQRANGNPGALIGFTQFGHVEYSGTLFISDSLDDDFAGFIFGYQSNRKFYVCSWKKRTQSYNILKNVTWPKSVGRQGIHLMVVDSSTGPGVELRDALWETGNTLDQSRVLWFDTNPAWQNDVSYRWKLVHNPDSGHIHIQWYQGSTLISDSGPIVDKTFRGGRVGMYVFSQKDVYFSALVTKAPQIKDFMLSFDGEDDYVDLGKISPEFFSTNKNFTLEAWIWTSTVSNMTCDLPVTDFGLAGQCNINPFFKQVTSPEDEADWLVRSGRTPSSSTGPSADHTNGSDCYMYFEASGKAIGDRAFLESEYFPSGPQCNMSFYYHMWDGTKSAGHDGVGFLKVDVRTEVESWKELFVKAGSQQNNWLRGDIDLSVYDGEIIAVRFTAIMGKAIRSDIAIDDVIFSPGCGNPVICDQPREDWLFGTDQGKGVHMSLSLGQLRFGLSEEQTFNSSSRVPSSQWTRVSVVYEAQNKQLELFMNASLDSTFHDVEPGIDQGRLLLGRNGEKYFRGQVGEVKVWNSAVSPDDPQTMYSSDEHLTGFFKFDEGEGSKTQNAAAPSQATLHGPTWLSSSLVRNDVCRTCGETEIGLF